MTQAFDPTPQKEGNILGIFDRGSNVQISPAKSSKPLGSEIPTKEIESSRTRETDARSPQICSTPSMRKTSVSIEDTPAYLRRRSLSAAKPDTESAALKTFMSRCSKPSLGRSLSSLVQELRTMQDEEFGEEARILNAHDIDAASRQARSDRSSLSPCDVQQPSEARTFKWKKKGQKRTTRPSNAKPNNSKWQPEPQWQSKAVDKESELDVASEDEVGAQQSALRKHILHQSKENDQSAPKKRRTINPNAQVHANFRALKIKNKGGKSGRGGKPRSRR